MEKNILPSKRRRKIEPYSAANIMKLKFLEVENGVSILAIIIGLEKDKNRALILSHNIDVKGGKLAVEEITFKPNATVNGQKNYLSKLRNENESCSIKSHFNAKTIKLTFLTVEDFYSLYEKMPKYVDFYRYDEWYSIFYDDNFTPDCSTYYIVRNVMLDWDLKPWEKANKFFTKYPNAVAYGEMPNVKLDVPLQEDCSNYSKNFPLRDINGIGPENEKKLHANGITVTKLFEKCKTINEQENYNYQKAKKCFISYLEENNITENHASMIFEDIDMTIHLSKQNFSMKINKEAENILRDLFNNKLKIFSPQKIPGIGPQYEKKLLRYFKEDKEDKKDIVCELFKEYITINQKQKYNHLATQKSFIVYLKKIGINRLHGLRIFYYMTATVTFIKAQLVKNIYELVTEKEKNRDHSQIEITEEEIQPGNKKTIDPDKYSTDFLEPFYSDQKELENDYLMIERYQENRSPINKVFGKEEVEEIEMTCKKYIKDIGLANDKIKLEEPIKKKDFINDQSTFSENSSKSELGEYPNLAEQLITANFEALCEIKTFDSFSRDDFLRLISEDFIKDKDQGIILDIIARWVEYDFSNRKSDWLNLVSRIDYTKVEHITLEEYVEKNKSIYLIPDLMEFLFLKICAKKNEKIVVSSVVSKNSYSKMILFGGFRLNQLVVEIDVQQNSVKKIRDLSIGKRRHCSEKIGNYVFVLGDYDSEKIEKYNLESNQSEVLSLEMTCNKYDYSSVVHSNRIYVIGGYLNSKSIDIVEYFEPEKMKWIDAPKLLQQIRCHDSVIVDEIMYAVGDYGSNKFQRFDPREGKWSFLADIPNETSFTALSVFEHTITCSGGVNTQSLCQVYDIRNNKWDKLANLTNPVYGAKSIENETSIIVAGGGYDNDQIQSYNKNNKTWSIMDIKLPYEKYLSSKIWL